MPPHPDRVRKNYELDVVEEIRMKMQEAMDYYARKLAEDSVKETETRNKATSKASPH